MTDYKLILIERYYRDCIASRLNLDTEIVKDNLVVRDLIHQIKTVKAILIFHFIGCVYNNNNDEVLPKLKNASSENTHVESLQRILSQWQCIKQIQKRKHLLLGILV